MHRFYSRECVILTVYATHWWVGCLEGRYDTDFSLNRRCPLLHRNHKRDDSSFFFVCSLFYLEHRETPNVFFIICKKTILFSTKLLNLTCTYIDESKTKFQLSLIWDFIIFQTNQDCNFRFKTNGTNYYGSPFNIELISRIINSSLTDRTFALRTRQTGRVWAACVLWWNGHIR